MMLLLSVNVLYNDRSYTLIAYYGSAISNGLQSVTTLGQSASEVKALDSALSPYTFLLIQEKGIK